MMDFFKKTKQPLIQEWLKVFMMRMIKYLPVAQLMKMGLNTVFTPKTKSWGKTGEVLAAYVREQKEAAHG
jgi:heterodisulfide reductase subunit C2